MIKTAGSFLTSTLKEKPWGIKAARILAASLEAVDPATAVKRVLKLQGQTLLAGERQFEVPDYGSIYLLSIGKAAHSMASAASDLLPDQISSGLILTKHEHRADRLPGKVFTYLQGGHPIPDRNSIKSGEEIITRLSGLSRDDLVIILISGGGSALFTVPPQGISLKDLQQTNQAFLEHGLDIQEINTIRKHLSRVKGGKLAEILYPAQTITLILSDVIGDPTDIIASGPTAPDNSTYQDALMIIKKYQLDSLLPPSVLRHIRAGGKGLVPETPKPGDQIFDNQMIQVIAGNNDAILGGLKQAQEEGFVGIRLEEELAGEARLAGEGLAKRLLQRRSSADNPSSCLIAGGETTVTLADIERPGKGGRNLELALSTVRPLADVDNIALITLATDGEDGVTDAAGAVVTGETMARALHLGLDPEEYLQKHDSYHFFQALDDLLLPGVTGTNTNDLCFLITF